MSMYACSDFHGFKSLYYATKEIITKEDKVIFLGDAADRGPFGWELIKLILDDPQWYYIIGNHDHMLFQSFLPKNGTLTRLRYARLHEMNGGYNTRIDYGEDSEKTQTYYLSTLMNCPYYFRYTNSCEENIYLSHSGAVHYTFFHDKNMDMKEKDEGLMEEFVWDRSEYLRPSDYGGYGIDRVIHGHTPIPHLINDLNFYQIGKTEEELAAEGDSEFIAGKAFFYDKFRRVNLDNATVVTGKATLLNLDTWESIPLIVSDEEKPYLWKE